MRAPPPLRALERVQRGLGPCLGLTHSIAGINPVHQLLRVIAAYGLIQGMTSDLVCITKCTRCFAGRSASHTHAHTHTHTHTLLSLCPPDRCHRRMSRGHVDTTGW